MSAKTQAVRHAEVAVQDVIFRLAPTVIGRWMLAEAVVEAAEPILAAAAARENAEVWAAVRQLIAQRDEARDALKVVHGENMSLRAAEQRIREMVETGYAQGETRWSGGQILDALDEATS